MQQRNNFKAHIASNFNYFGNITKSNFKSVITIQYDTTFEELKCVGLQPSLDRLEAVVYIKQQAGYGGNVCTSGSREYIRFYISMDDGTTWQDQGSTSFTVYDIPDKKPLEYATTIEINPKKFFCFKENILKVRAILSWNFSPPVNTPNFIPVWGNVIESHIQIDPSKIMFFEDLLKESNIEISSKLKDIVDEKQEIKLNENKVPSLSDIHSLYQKKDVPTHRYVFSEFQKFVTKAPEIVTAENLSSKDLFESIGINSVETINKILATQGNTTYEQLECIGLDPNRDALIGIMHLKLSSGYSGNLCSKGSQEYVAFWIDWDDGSGWNYVGTASVNVHDINQIPPDGLKYGLYLPVDVSKHLQNCNKGPKIVKVRATLSWEALPSSWDPNFIPVWGNRVDSLSHIKPGTPNNTGIPNISILGGIGINDINVFGNGKAKSGSLFALTGSQTDEWLHSRECPFGGRVTVQGYPSVGYKYRAIVRKQGSFNEIKVTDNIRTVDFNGIGTWRTADSNGFFTYLNAYENIDNILAWWDTAGNESWEIKLEIADMTGTTLGSTLWYMVQLDNTAPNPVEIHIDSGGDCKSFEVNNPASINGTFKAIDDNLASYGISLLPFASPAGSLSPTTGYSNTNISGNPWSLQTNTLQPCGYVLQLSVSDLTIRNSSPGLHNRNSASVGFCLLAPKD